MCATPRVTLRVDASATIGTGHLRRCLSLAQALVELGAVQMHQHLSAHCGEHANQHHPAHTHAL